MRRTVLCVLGCAVGASAAPAAQGFGVYEHGTCTMGRSGVAAAKPCDDGSAIFFNPAGLAGLAGTHIAAGVSVIAAGGKFTDDVTTQSWDLDNPVIPIPNVYFTHAFGPKVTAGVGLYIPFGLETRWSNAAAYDSVAGTFRPSRDLFPGRFLGWNSRLQAIYVQPTVGYQVHPRLKLGVGVAFVASEVELKQRVDFSQQIVPSPDVPAGTRFAALGIPTGSDFADAHLQASGNGMVVNFGAIAKLGDRVSIGGHYMTRVTIDYDGDARFTQLPTGLVLPPGNPLSPTTPVPVDGLVAPLFAAGAQLSDQTATTSITLPNQGSIGIAWEATDAWTLMADYQTVIWGWFNQLEIDFENAVTPDVTQYEGYRDTHGFRFGAEWRYSPKVTLRGGYLYHTAAAPVETVTPLLPEGARNEWTIGLGWKVTPHLTADFGYQLIRQNDRRGRVYEPAIGNTGLYEFGAHLVGVGLAYTF